MPEPQQSASSAWRRDNIAPSEVTRWSLGTRQHQFTQPLFNVWRMGLKNEFFGRPLRSPAISKSLFRVAQIPICRSHAERLCVLKREWVTVPMGCSDCRILWQEWEQAPSHWKMQCHGVKASLRSLKKTWKSSRVGDISRSCPDPQKKTLK